MGIHVAGTQRGLKYALAPLNGERAPLLKALFSRAPAAHIAYWPLQQLVWEIEGGLSYNEMPLRSRQLVDQLAPEYRDELREDFVATLQEKANRTSSAINRIIRLGGIQINTQAIDVLLARYKTSRQILLRYENNYQELARNLVHIIPGTAPNPGPAFWSQISSRVYARLTGDAVYGQIAYLEVRVLPGAAYGESMGGTKGSIEDVSYPSDGRQDSRSNTGSELANVPLESMLYYPNAAARQIDNSDPLSVPTVKLDTPKVSGTAVSVDGVATPATPGAAITKITWNWGDGTPAQIGGFPEAHTYAKPGNYTITVAATDSNGLTGSASVSAQVLASLACSNGFSLNVEYGGNLYQECIEGDPSAFNELTVQYQGGNWPPLAAKAVYLQGVVTGLHKLTDIQIFEDGTQVSNSVTRYQIAYATLLWGWEYGRLGINPGFLARYHSLEDEIQKYAQSNSWRELAVGASKADAWLNPMYWINQGINALFAEAGALNESESEKELTDYMGLLNTLSQGYQSAVNQVGAYKTKAAMNDFGMAGICLPANYTASQFERALAKANPQSVKWDQLAAGLFQGSLDEVPSGAPLTINGAGLGASCLLNLAADSHALTVKRAAAVETECLAKSASVDLTKFLLKQTLTQGVLDAGMEDLAAQQGTDQAVETVAEQTAARDAVEFYVDQSLSRLFFALSIADTIDESYNLPMADKVQQSIDAGNAALQTIPTFFHQVSSLSSGSTADIGIAPTTTDTDGLLNGTLAVLYLADAQYCSKTLPVLGCQNQVSSYQTNAQAYAGTAADVLSAQSAASRIAALLPGSSAPFCAAPSLNGGPISSPAPGSNLPSHTIQPGGISISPTTMQSPASAPQGSITLSVSPSTVASGAQFTVSGTVRDATGGPETGATVQISATVNGNTLPLITVTTAGNGSFSALVNAPPVAGSVVISATAQSVSPPVQGSATLTVTGSR